MATGIGTMLMGKKILKNFPPEPIYHKKKFYCKTCKSKMHGDRYERNKEYQKENASRHRVELRENLRGYVY